MRTFFRPLFLYLSPYPNYDTVLNRQIGNPLIRYSVDTAATYIFLWSHGVISQKTFKGIRKSCDFNQYALTGVISDACGNFISNTYAEEGSYINGYDVLLDVCLPGIAEQELRLHKKVSSSSSFNSLPAENTANSF